MTFLVSEVVFVGDSDEKKDGCVKHHFLYELLFADGRWALLGLALSSSLLLWIWKAPM